MWNAEMASNMNFPAPLAVMGFLAASGGMVTSLGAAGVAAFMGKMRFARLMLLVMGSGAVGYFFLLAGFSLGSRPKTLARGQEKYFCEIDCHLAYSVVEVKAAPAAETMRYAITLRTRFDETTTSPSRPKDVPLTPSPHEVRLVDERGREFLPVQIAGASLLTPLTPGHFYSTEIQFDAPKNAAGLRLLIQTEAKWADRLVIGDENSWWHQKTYLAL